MTEAREFRGSDDEAKELLLAIDTNCHCEYNTAGVVQRLCGAHEILNEQRSLDGLLFMRRKRDCLEREEWRGRKR